MDCLSISSCGICCWTRPSPRMRMCTSGDWIALVFSPLNQLIVPSLMEQLLLNIGGGCGNHGLLRNAKFFSGSPSGIGAGLRIVWRGVACHTRPCVRSVTRKKKISNTCLLRVFSREFWFRILTPMGFQGRVSSRHEISFADWWRKAVKKVPKETRKGLNSTIILGAWVIWKHRNACVFDGARPCINSLLRAFRDEQHLWCLAGARRLRTLGHGQVGELGNP